jgi:uncharacterized protein
MEIDGRGRGRQLFVQWGIYFFGLFIMSFGIVLTIVADLGVSPWDVLHIGLYKQFGLTIGSWSIIVGIFILVLSSVITKSLPKLGALVNMVAVGLFIDMYLLIPWLKTPNSFSGQMLMFFIGTVIMAYGIGFYISAHCGAGPRDSLMLALTDFTGIKIQYIRAGIELVVLAAGSLLGGPVFIGTVIFCFIIGPLVGVAMPHCQRISDMILSKAKNQKTIQINHFHN